MSTYQQDVRRSASVPIGLRWTAAANQLEDSVGWRKAVVLSTPPAGQLPKGQQQLRPLKVASQPPAGGSEATAAQADATSNQPLATTAAEAEDRPLSPAKKRAPQRSHKSKDSKHGQRPHGTRTEFDEQLDLDGKQENLPLMTEVIRLRARIHKLACELADTKNQLELSQRELRLSQEAGDELRLKHSNLERKERRTSSELLEERRKNEELGKQVKAMGQNLMSLSSLMDTGDGKDNGGSGGLGLQKRCFKLVQQNTALTVQASLLARQKGWAEAKARVMQDELTSVYLGTHDRVKDSRELEAATEREFNESDGVGEEAEIVKLMLPQKYQHTQAVVDFLTHINHSRGRDVEGFLQSSRIFSEGMRSECLSGLGREFYANWQRNRKVPQILSAVERVVHLNDLYEAFDSIAQEVAALLGCGQARIWIVDHFRQLHWTCVRGRDSETHSTVTVPFAVPTRPCTGASSRGTSKNPSASAGDPTPAVSDNELEGKSFIASTFATQRPVNVSDVGEDPRYLPAVDAVTLDCPLKSTLCVPIGEDGKVFAVMQAMNKLREPEFDPQEDMRVMRLLGRVSMEVIKICETSGASTINAKRKESLVQLLSKHLPLELPSQLLQLLEAGLAELFMAKATALHLVYGQGQPPEKQHTVRLIAERAGRTSRTATDCLLGIVGQVARTMNNYSVSASQLQGSEWHKEVDLPVQERMVIHTVPICEGSSCRAVCQFLCKERDRTMIADDGVYQPNNTSHFRLLSILLNLVAKHLHVIDPKGHGGSKGSSDAVADS